LSGRRSAALGLYDGRGARRVGAAHRDRVDLDARGVDGLRVAGVDEGEVVVLFAGGAAPLLGPGGEHGVALLGPFEAAEDVAEQTALDVAGQAGRTEQVVDQRAADGLGHRLSLPVA
jgi:hypothetical protein